MPQAYFKLGPFNLYFYGLFISLGIIIWYFYLKLIAINKKILADLDIIFIISLLSALLGARIYHVLSSFSYYKNYPFEILFFWQGGLGIFGAIFGGLTGLFVFAKIKKINLIPLLNIISPPLLIVQAVGRIGNYFNHEVYSQTNFPIFFLESTLCLFSFFLYFFLIKKRFSDKFGFSFYLITYGIIRFFTEFLRIDTWLIYNIHTAHIFSFIMIISGFWLLSKTFKTLYN